MKDFAPFRFIAMIISLFLCIACSSDENPNTLAYEQQLNLSYGTHVNHQLDVYLPEGRDANTKVIIAIHGGGFITGERNDIITSVQTLIDRGFAVVNMTYRFVDTTGVFQDPIIHQPSDITIDDQLEDIKSALTFVSNRTSDWNVSDTNWAMFGHSAGATLSLLYVHGEHNENNQIKAVGNLAGALDFSFEDESQFDLLDPRLVEILYRAIGAEPVNENKLAYMAKSPFWVSYDNSNPEPTINIRAENDGLSADNGVAQFSAYTNMLNNKGVINKYIVIEGADHGFSTPGDWEETAHAMADFFEVNM